MEHYAGIDVSLEESSVCIVEATGTIVGQDRQRARGTGPVFRRTGIACRPHWA
jgi:hypothetical protein